MGGEYSRPWMWRFYDDSTASVNKVSCISARLRRASVAGDPRGARCWRSLRPLRRVEIPRLSRSDGSRATVMSMMILKSGSCPTFTASPGSGCSSRSCQSLTRRKTAGSSGGTMWQVLLTKWAHIGRKSSIFCNSWSKRIGSFLRFFLGTIGFTRHLSSGNIAKDGSQKLTNMGPLLSYPFLPFPFRTIKKRKKLRIRIALRQTMRTEDFGGVPPLKGRREQNSPQRIGS